MSNYQSIDQLDESELNDELGNTLWQGLEQRITREKRKEKMLVMSRVAALVLILLSIGYFTVRLVESRSVNDDVIAFLQENQPDGSSDKIMLAVNGDKYYFSPSSNADLHLKNGAVMHKSNDTIYFLGEKIKNEPTYIDVPKQKVLTIVMNDGTICTLNANTAIAFNADFKANKRNIGLIGSGRFNVVHDSNRPMSVIIGRDTIVDIGTTFYVRQYTTDNAMEAAVQEGKISIYKTIIHAGEQVLVDKKNIAKLKYDNSNIERLYITQTSFSFEEEKMQNVLKQIANWYGLVLNDTSTTCDKTFTGQLPTNLSLEAIIEILNDLSDCRITITKTNKGQETLTIN